MSAPKSDVHGGLINRPHHVASALREIADWLDEHSEVTPDFAWVSIDATERKHLETLAVALGERATETESYDNKRVEVAGAFGKTDTFRGVRVSGEVPIEKLADAPVVKPKYRPIIGDLDAATGEGRR